FIGNRIGCLWMLAGLHLADKAMRDDGLNIETIDALTSAPLGLPPTGLYGLIDLIGLDVMHNVGNNLRDNLPADDAGRRFTQFPDAVQRLHDRGQLGRKSGGGFYKLIRHDDGAKTMQVFDLAADDWRVAERVELPAHEQHLTGLFDSDSANGRFVRDLVTTTLCYAADLVPEISDDIVNIDRAMRWGFNWQHGPFQLIDQLGAARLAATLTATNSPQPKMLRVLADSDAESFYRDDGREYLTVDRKWERVK
ncbi:MAG: 3-hydroxyacyl-CoA dehydrogenase family protein, partial [bacterium]